MKFEAPELQLIADMFAAGLTVEDFAEQFGLKLLDAKKLLSQDIEVRKAKKEGEDRFAMSDADSRRRDRIKRKENWFIPTNDELIIIEELSRLGWSEYKIAEQFDVSLATWKATKEKYPQIQDHLKRGQAGANGQLAKSVAKEWRPDPHSLQLIEEFAGEGFTPDVIAVKIGISVSCLMSKIHEIPEVNEAYERGLKKLEGEVVSKLVSQVRSGNTAAIIYFLKSRNKNYWSDSAPRTTETVVQTQPTATIVNLPKPDETKSKSFEKDGARFKRDGKK